MFSIFSWGYVQDYKASSRRKRRVKTTTGSGRLQGSTIAYDSESESDSSDSSGEEDDMDANSLSFRDDAGGLKAAMSHRKRIDNDRGGENSSDEDSSDGETTGVSRKMADTYITESMSVTPASSVAVGSLMGRSLGNAMASSFADDGLVWGGGGVGGGAGAGAGAGIEDDAFFHENVSPSASPPLAAAPISGRTEAASSRRTLF